MSTPALAADRLTEPKLGRTAGDITPGGEILEEDDLILRGRKRLVALLVSHLRWSGLTAFRKRTGQDPRRPEPARIPIPLRSGARLRLLRCTTLDLLGLVLVDLLGGKIADLVVARVRHNYLRM